MSNPHFLDPDWWRHAVVYQVYPRSFRDSNGDGIGDLEGIVERLDHLVDLGVDTVWVSPFFASPQEDFGYDVSDYCGVAPEYGTLQDAERLIDEAHRRGLRVLFDLVLNHTSHQHPWFLESRSSRDNPKADWYIWRDGRGPDGKRPPNNWRSIAEITSGWQWAEERQQWYLATFLPCQPDLNWRNPEVREAMFGAVRFWLERGVDGFRLDMFGDIMKDESFADLRFRPRLVGGIPRLWDRSPIQNTEDNVELARELRAVCRGYDRVGDAVGTGPAAADRERLLIGEVFGKADELRRFLADGDGLQLVFLFDFLTFRYDPRWLVDRIVEFERAFPYPSQPTYVLENHDRTRLLDRVGFDRRFLGHTRALQQPHEVRDGQRLAAPRRIDARGQQPGGDCLVARKEHGVVDHDRAGADRGTQLGEEQRPVGAGRDRGVRGRPPPHSPPASWRCRCAGSGSATRA